MSRVGRIIYNIQGEIVAQFVVNIGVPTDIEAKASVWWEGLKSLYINEDSKNLGRGDSLLIVQYISKGMEGAWKIRTILQSVTEMYQKFEDFKTTHIKMSVNVVVD